MAPYDTETQVTCHGWIRGNRWAGGETLLRRLAAFAGVELLTCRRTAAWLTEQVEYECRGRRCAVELFQWRLTHVTAHARCPQQLVATDAGPV